MLMVSVPHHWDEVAARALLADGGCSDSQTLVESLTWLREHPAAEVCCFGGARGCGRGLRCLVWGTPWHGVCIWWVLSWLTSWETDHYKCSQQVQKSVPLSEFGLMAFSSLSFLICCGNFLVGVQDG